MNKQIEEMVSVLYPYINAITPGKHRTEAVEVLEEKSVCEKLYRAGYRKIPEGAVVLTREEAETIYGTLKANEEFIFDLQEAAMVCKKEMEEAQEVAVKEIAEYVQQARKETAEKYHAEIEKAIDSVPNATKEFVEAWKEKNDEIFKEFK